MSQAFLITFRDSIEAFVIVGVALACLRKAQRRALLSAIYSAIPMALLATVIGAQLWATTENQSFWRGSLTLVTAAFAASLMAQLLRTTSASPREGAWKWLAVCLFTVLMIVRKGIETGPLIATWIVQVRAIDLTVGAIGGVVVAAVMAWLWSRYGPRLRRPVFLQVTRVFLTIFVTELAISGFHDLTEANVFPVSATWHSATEPFSSDGIYGHYLTYLLIAAPLAWLLVAVFLGHGKASDDRIAHVGR